MLEQPELEPVFAKGSRAEVSLMGTFRLKGQERAVSGRIDRLAVTDDAGSLSWTSRPTASRRAAWTTFPSLIEAARHLRSSPEALYPKHEIECVLVYTESARVVSLSQEVLDGALAELNTK